MVEQERRQRRDRRPSLIGEEPLRHEIEKREGRGEQPIFQNEEARQRRPGNALHRPQHPFIKRRLLQHIAGLKRLGENVGGDVVLRQVMRDRKPHARIDEPVKHSGGDDAGEAERPGRAIRPAMHFARATRLKKQESLGQQLPALVRGWFWMIASSALAAHRVCGEEYKFQTPDAHHPPDGIMVRLACSRTQCARKIEQLIWTLCGQCVLGWAPKSGIASDNDLFAIAPPDYRLTRTISRPFAAAGGNQRSYIKLSRTKQATSGRVSNSILVGVVECNFA